MPRNWFPIISWKFYKLFFISLIYIIEFIRIPNFLPSNLYITFIIAQTHNSFARNLRFTARANRWMNLLCDIEFSKSLLNPNLLIKSCLAWLIFAYSLQIQAFIDGSMMKFRIIFTQWKYKPILFGDISEIKC